MKHLCDILSESNVRLLVVGGAGSLYVNPEHTAVVSDGPDFPLSFAACEGSGQGAFGASSEKRRKMDVYQPCRRF